MYFSYIEAEAKPIEKKKLCEKIKEKENLQRKKQEELRKQVSLDMAVFHLCFFFLSKKLCLTFSNLFNI